MVSITLDERDRAVLEHLREGNADVGSLAQSVDSDPDSLRERLPELADNGLVQQVHDDVYAITDNGKRTIAGSPAGRMDDRIDTPPDVERQIGSFDLRPDREAAVRGAFAFLQYWGDATGGEIVDGIYSEHPAGYPTPQEWWDDCVRDRLADLPLVESPDPDELAWRYAETPTIERPTGDGRDVAGAAVTAGTSARYDLEQSDLGEDERDAIRAAFDRLVRAGDASVDELGAEIYPDHGAGYDSPDEWWRECVRDAFASLPGVERTNEDRDLWAYDPSLDEQ